MDMTSLVIFTIFSLKCVLAQEVPNLIVNTTQGQVRGVWVADGNHSMYLGIPYGKVVESNPFGPSIAHPEFDRIFEANDDSHICPQIEEFNRTLVGDLDCLRLNIFVPATATPTSKLPVLVWFYGGGFEIGFYGRFLYGAKFLVRHDIILVSINYRVGPYGFMCLDVPEIPGNQGLKDQLLALRWLHENIEAFGGDRGKVTISGNSAGGISVDLHLVRRNEGPKLFDKAIIQSGTIFTLFYEPPLLDTPLIIANYLEFPTDNRTQALRYLATVDPLTIIQAVHTLGIYFRPCIEMEFNGIETFILNDPLSTTLLPAIKDMPIIVGFNSEELYFPTAIGGFNYTTSDLLATRFHTTHSDFKGMDDIVKHFYFGDEVFDEESLQSAVELRSDISFIYPSIRRLKNYLENEAEVYLYMFSYVGGRNFVQHMYNVTGASSAWHADEVGYLFDISYMDEPTPEDQLIVDQMTTMWANFVRSGDPTPATSELLPHKWEPITKGSPRHFINIDTPLSVGISPYNERMTFWDFFLEINGHLELNVDSVSTVKRNWRFIDIPY